MTMLFTQNVDVIFSYLGNDYQISVQPYITGRGGGISSIRYFVTDLRLGQTFLVDGLSVKKVKYQEVNYCLDGNTIKSAVSAILPRETQEFYVDLIETFSETHESPEEWPGK